MKDCYAIKDVGVLTIKEKEHEFTVNTANEIGIITTDEANILIVRVEVISDDWVKTLSRLRKAEFKLDLQCKSASTGEYSNKERVFNDMSFVKLETEYSCDEPSEFIYIFSNKKYKKIKKELGAYFQKEEMKNYLNSLNRIANRLTEGVSDIKYALNDLEITLKEVPSTINIKSNSTNYVKDMIDGVLNDIARGLNDNTADCISWDKPEN